MEFCGTTFHYNTVSDADMHKRPFLFFINQTQKKNGIIWNTSI